jgi:hypothetical protein
MGENRDRTLAAIQSGQKRNMRKPPFPATGFSGREKQSYGLLRASKRLVEGRSSLWIRRHQRKKPTMPGWIIIFAVLFLLGLTSALAGNPLGSSLAPKLVTGMSGTLLLACVVTRIVRRA